MYKGTEIAPINLAAQEGKNPKVLEIIQEAYKLKPNERFLAAIIEGDISKIEKIIINSRIGNVDMPKDDEGNTALILAVQKENVTLAISLLKWKADINIQNKKGESALTLALKLKNPRLIGTLLDIAYNIEIDQPDKDGNTPLMLAVEANYIDIIKKIIDEVPDPTKTNAKGETIDALVKDTPNKTKILELLADAKNQYTLHKAIVDQDLSVIKNSNAPLNILSAERNPLVVAISQRKRKLVEDIIDKGADVNQILRGNRTPLWQAVSLANIDIFKFLLERDANPNIADIYDDYTPIFLAIRNDKPLIMQSLLNKANVNYQASSSYPGKIGNITPLMFAVQEKSGSSVRKLLEAGANPLLKNSEGETALDMARREEKRTSTYKKEYQDMITLLENKIKTIPPSTPVTPITSSQLISLLQNLTQQLQGLLKVLQKN